MGSNRMEARPAVAFSLIRRLPVILGFGILATVTQANDLAIEWYPSGAGALLWRSAPGLTQTLHETGDLLQWTVAATVPENTVGPVAKHPIVRGMRGFYRVVSEIPSAFVLHPGAIAYQARAGLSPAAAMRVSKFFSGLDQAGLADAFLDGCVFREDSNGGKASGAYSLRGLADLALYGNPQWRRNGLSFDGIDDYAVGGVPPAGGGRTLVVAHAGNLSNTSMVDRRIVDLRQAGGNPLLAINVSGPNAQILSAFQNARFLTAGALGWSRNTVGLQLISVRDDGAASSVSLSHQRLANSGASFSRVSGQGEAPHVLNSIRIGVLANASMTAIYNHCERMVGGWFLFSRALNDSEEQQLQAILDSSILPKWRMIWEGDSLSNDLSSRAHDKGALWGANIDIRMRWAGGETSANGVAQLGSPQGLEDSLFGGMPVLVRICFGANDLANLPGSGGSAVTAIHANLRTIWAYARARQGVVIASTVMPARGITQNGREADRQWLNALIRADAGTHYDILHDADQWAGKATSTRPCYDDLSIFRDGIHLSLGTGQGADQLALDLARRIDFWIP